MPLQRPPQFLRLSPTRGWLLAAGVFVPWLFAGCATRSEHLANADRAVYSILEQRRAELDAPGEFSIDPQPDSLRQRMLAGEQLGPVDLISMLAIAAENSRDYQRRKEDLYLAALDLTLERFGFQAQRSGQLSALLDGQGGEAQDLALGAGAGITRLLGVGASWIGDIGLSLAKDLTSGDGWGLTSNLGLSVTQPLLRGFGRRIVMEPLTQAERNVVYQTRSFERFRRTFAVDVTSRYLRILQQANQVENERANFENLTLLRERNNAWSKAGRLSEVQAAQAEQNELSSKNRLIEQEQRLQTAVDELKLFLGLPIEFDLQLEAAELEQLEAGEGLVVGEEDAIRFALSQRLDYLTVLDQIADAERKSYIAGDRLRTTLDVTASANAVSAANKPLKYDSDSIDWRLGLRLDLPIDRIADRNAYRESLITLERAKRAEVEFADGIRVDLRDELRQARTQLETLRIQENAVALADRRVESTVLNQSAGRAETRDILEAQEALRQARNALITARVDYHLSRLNLWRDMELLRVDESGVHPDETLLAADSNLFEETAQDGSASDAAAPQGAPQGASR